MKVRKRDLRVRVEALERHSAANVTLLTELVQMNRTATEAIREISQTEIALRKLVEQVATIQERVIHIVERGARP